MTSHLLIKSIKAIPTSCFPISAKFDQFQSQVFEPLEGFFLFLLRISNGAHEVVCGFLLAYTVYKKIAKTHVINFAVIEKLIHRTLYFRKKPFWDYIFNKP